MPDEVDDSSPLITYSGLWSDTPANDTLARNYSAGSLHMTDVQGAVASFTFHGTGVWFYGGHRPDYGNYTFSVDGDIVATGSAAAPSPVTDQLLGGRLNLSMGTHTAILANTGGGPLDLDALIFETQIGDGLQVSAMVTEDSDESISYSPSSPAWNVASHDYFSGGTVHFTETDGAQASMSFSGNAIAVYGGVSFDHGNYAVAVDGDTRKLDGGTASVYHPKSLLYFVDGLNSGKHNLTITTEGKFFDLDSITTYSAASPSKSSGPTAANPTSSGIQISDKNGPVPVDQASHAGTDASSSTTKSISEPVLIGIIVASTIGLIALVLLVLFIAIEIRKPRHRHLDGAQRLSSPVLPIQNPDLEFGNGAPPFSEKRSETNLARNNTNSTTKFAKSGWSRWSQESFVSGPPQHLNLADAPTVPPVLLAVPNPGRANSPNLRRAERHSHASGHADNTRAPVVRDDDGQGSVVDNYYYRNSIASSISPIRPSRPPSLNLENLGPEFDHVPLST